MITTEKLTIPAADLGEASPLPDIKNNVYIHAPIKVSERIGDDELPNIKKGMIPTMLPYLTQDGYNRKRELRKLDIIVLENEYLRAEFFPGLGGRLRRLYDKEDKRELLYVNPVFQPCNLALRNAWFSGGVEFNVGIKGHNPLTCSPLFAEKRVDSKGNEYVSFYEYERIRGVVWSVNAYLPEGARSLTVKCCIENLSDDEKFMYWWSNIAVDTDKETRVIVPTRDTYINYFEHNSYVLDKSTHPYTLGTDVSYPENLNRSLDFFYKIPKDEQKWISSIDKEGKGLLHTSDNILFGRKLFVWGTAPGGRHWGEYLSDEGGGYIEIQAGLAHTQLEHFKMSGKSEIQWTEHYSPIAIDPERAHGDWDTAVCAVRDKIPSEAPDFCLEAPEKLKSKELLFCGSDWGALEVRVRGERISRYFNTWESDIKEAEDFNTLLDTGVLPCHSKIDEPKGYAVGKFWCDKMKASLSKDGGAHHSAYLRLGTALYEQGCRGDADAMAECLTMWKKSAEILPNPLAYRNIAAYYANELKDFETAVSYAEKALSMNPHSIALAIDSGSIFLSGGKYEKWATIYEALPAKTKEAGRARLLYAKALIELGRLDEAEKIVNEHFEMPDIKEGEFSISTLWFKLRAKQNGITEDEAKQRFTLPYSIDFRMH